MNGILIIDKPFDWTSHDVIGKLRRLLKIKRIGHTGTLDPFATGVLVILVGQATRLAQFLDKDLKEYEAVVRLGFETETGDFTGNPKTQKGTAKNFSLPEIQEAVSKFHGDIQQIPPMYSAKKIAGKKLYEMARKGLEIERSAVAVRIHEISAFEITENAFDSQNLTFDFGLKVCSSAGTYIRVLAEDIGHQLSTGGHLLALRRLRAGNFSLNEALKIEDVEKLLAENKLQSVLISMNEALSKFPQIILSAEKANKIRHGMSLELLSEEYPNQQFLRLTDEKSNLIALAIFEKETKLIKPRIVFN